MKIVCVGGGSGGHVNPAISLLTKIAETDRSQSKYYLVADQRCIKYIENLSPDIQVWILDIPKTPKNIFLIILNSFSYLKAMIKIYQYLREVKPDVVVGFGSYVSFFFIIVSKILGIKTILHEQNIVPGKTTSLLKNLVDYVAVSFSITKKILLNQAEVSDLLNESCLQNDQTKEQLESHIIWTGNPVRLSLIQTTEKEFHQDNKFKILIFGGSQAASVFDEVLPEIIYEVYKEIKEENANFDLEITHQARFISVKNSYTKLGLNANVSDYFHDMDKEYESTDLVISRSGASTIFELIHKGQPSILVPYPESYGHHQFYHAKYLANLQCAWLIEQDQLKYKLKEKILFLISNRQNLIDCSKNLIKLQDNWANNLSNLINKNHE